MATGNPFARPPQQLPRLPLALLQLLEKFPAVGAESRVTHEIMIEASGEIMKYVSRDLSHSLARFIVDNILLDKPGVLVMEDCYYDRTTRFRAQVHVLSAAEMRSLLQQAFDAGRGEMYKEMGGF